MIKHSVGCLVERKMKTIFKLKFKMSEILLCGKFESMILALDRIVDGSLLDLC